MDCFPDPSLQRLREQQVIPAAGSGFSSSLPALGGQQGPYLRFFRFITHGPLTAKNVDAHKKLALIPLQSHINHKELYLVNYCLDKDEKHTPLFLSGLGQFSH